MQQNEFPLPVTLKISKQNKHQLVYALKLRSMAKMNKQYLPEKICECCKRPFSWRKKWEKNWEEVKYCSDKCRMTKKSGHIYKIP